MWVEDNFQNEVTHKEKFYFFGYPEKSIQDSELPRRFILDCLFLSYANVWSKNIVLK